MNDSNEQDFFNLTKFTENKYIDRDILNYFYQIINKDTDVKYNCKEFNKFIYEFSMCEIISLIQEVNILFQITHPAILKYIGYNPINLRNQPKPVIITECSSNLTLKNILELQRKGEKHHQIDDTKKLIIIYGIAAGMSFLHTNNILHRNLKPGNIYLDDDFHPKISGFSLSLQISEEADRIKSEFVGTPTYLAPEILLTKEYSKKSDVYAFSLIVYEI